MEFVYQGELTLPDLEAVVDSYKKLRTARMPKAQLVDTLAVTSVPQEIGSILNELLTDYRDHGGREVVMVANNSLNAMLGRSMSFGAGLKLKVFDNRQEALKYIVENLNLEI
ncbi:MAG: hypothetical protein AAGF12_34035 [Myxococcota bacterium]